MRLILIISILGLFGCMNKVEVPSEVKVSGTTEVHVTHSITLSADILGVLKDSCNTEANQLGLQVGTTERDAYIQGCMTLKQNELMAALLDAINGVSNAQP